MRGRVIRGLVGLVFGLSTLSSAEPYLMEDLGRSVVALRTNATDVYVGWRLLATDTPDTAFNLYRATGGAAPVLLNGAPISATTNFVDTSADLGQPNAYHVRPVVGGIEQAPSGAFTLPANDPGRGYLSIPLVPPPGGLTPIGEAYAYTANDASVGDLDGDGEYEIVLKWDPTNAHDNAQDGYTGNVYLDAYKLNGTRLWRIDLGRNIRAGAHYTQFMVFDLDGDHKAEVACKTADATIDGAGVVIGDISADYRNGAGRILDGPEFLTIFNGETGAAMATVPYNPPRGDVCLWGNDGGGRPECYGNRVDRFLAGIAYLDGKRPSLIMARGYYDRSVIAAWNWRGGALTPVWTFDTHDGTPGNLLYAGQGNHQLSVADVDGDGKQEIVYGAMSIDDDGRGLYTTRLHHGDALHVTDMDPDRPGLEVFMPHEVPSQVAGAELRDARTGQLIWGAPTADDNGRGLALDIDPTRRGFELWTAQGVGLRDLAGTRFSGNTPSINHAVWWDADLLRELLDGTTISKWDWTTNTAVPIFQPAGVSSNNGTKANPAVTADILGDWREEVVWRASDSSELRIFSTTIPAVNRIFTLMHDPQYRVAIAWQNTAYNQPPHPGFYLGDGMNPPVAPDITVDPSAPARPANPVIQAILDDTGISSSDRVTADGALSLTGTAEPGVTVALYEGVTPLGTTVADGTGRWTFDNSASVLASGSHFFSATASDGTATSGSLPPFQVVVDATGPLAVSSSRFNPIGERTSVTTVVYQVLFSERVTGLTPAAFQLTTTDTVAGTISAVHVTQGTLAQVTVSGITGQGTMRLDVKATGSGLVDLAGNPLAAGFTGGQTYAFVTPTWTQPVSGGLWGDGANWAEGLVGEGLGLTANFATLDLTAENLVHLDAPRTIGNLLFGDTDPATAGAWTIDDNGDPANVLSLSVVTGAPVITVNNMGTGQTTFRAGLTSLTGLTKAGPGVLALAAPNAITGTAAINAGTLRVADGGVFAPGTVNISTGGARLNVAGGTFTATGTVNITAGGGSGVYVDGGNATFTTITSNNSSGAVVRIAGGNVTAGSISFPRTSDGVPNYATGLVVTGGNTAVGTLGLGTNNSYGVMSIEGGSLTAAGMVSVGNLGSNSNRGGAMRVLGGTFTSTDAVNGVVMTQRNNNTSIATFTGGISTVEKFTLGFNASVLSGVANLTVNGGSLFVGGGGLVKNGVGTFTANVTLASGVLGARTDWTTAVNLTLPAGSTIAIHTADAEGAAHDITLTGALVGAGGFSKTGAGTLVLAGANTYASDTTVSAGTLRVDGSLAAGGVVSVNGGGSLAGAGTVGREVSLAGGTVAPGHAGSPATLSAASVAWSAGTLALDLGGTSDSLAVAGALTKAGGGPYAVALTSEGPLPIGASYVLASFGSTDFAASDFTLTPPLDHEGLLTVDGGTLRFTVTKHDSAPPVLTLPGPVVVEALSAAGAPATFAATASDAVDGDVAVRYSQEPGTVFALGITTVTVTAVDLSGNTATGTFTVTVQDTTAPALTVPPDVTVEATSPAGAAVTFAGTATDLVSGDVTVAFTPASGSTFPIGTTTVTATATDAAGNTASGSFNVTVADTTAPAFVNLSARPDVLWPADGHMKRVRVRATLSDSGDAAPRARIVSVSSDEPLNAESPYCDRDGRRRHHGAPRSWCEQVDWEITGALTLELRAERDPDGDGRVYTLTVEATDRAGNITTQTTTVTVPRRRPRDDHHDHDHRDRD